MNMWRFISLVAVEEEPIRPNDFHCGHYYASLSHRPAKQDIKFSMVSHPFRRSRANARLKLRAERAGFLPASNGKSVNAKEPSASSGS